MVDPKPKKPRDPHPEVSAPIVDLSLEAQIARAEQAVVDRGARVRGDARRIVQTLRSKRGEAMRWAAIAGAAGTAAAVGYAGYRAWRAKRGPEQRRRDAEEAAPTTSFVAEVVAIARLATQWALRLHREQGVAGSLFGMLRDALRPDARAASNASAPQEAAADGHGSPPTQ